jgi:hypothetical protein
MSWTLVIFIYAGMLASGDSVTLTHITGFKSEQHCEAAGAATKPLVKGSAKEIRHLCIRQE